MEEWESQQIHKGTLRKGKGEDQGSEDPLLHLFEIVLPEVHVIRDFLEKAAHEMTEDIANDSKGIDTLELELNTLAIQKGKHEQSLADVDRKDSFFTDMAQFVNDFADMVDAKVLLSRDICSHYFARLVFFIIDGEGNRI